MACCDKFEPCDCGDCEFARTHLDGIWAGKVKCVNCKDEREDHSYEAIMNKEPNPEHKPTNELPVIYQGLRASSMPEAKQIMIDKGFTPIEVPCAGCREAVLVDQWAHEDATLRAEDFSIKPMLTYCHVCVNEMYTPQEHKGLA